MKTKKEILWITQTALLLGLTVATQYYLTTALGGAANPVSQLVVGSLVNLFLIISVLTCGFWSGFSIGTIAPLIAFSVGRLPHIWLLPFIALGNIAIVFVFWLICKKNILGPKFTLNWAVASIAGAALKFGVLWLGVTQIVLKFLLYDTLPPKQIEMLAFTFSVPQLATALTGCVLTYAIYPIIKNIVIEKTADVKNR